MKKWLSVLFCLAGILLVTSPVYGKDVTIAWDPVVDAEISGYRIYYDTDPLSPYEPAPADFADEGPPPLFIEASGHEFTLHGLQKYKKYFITVAAVGLSGEDQGPVAEAVVVLENADSATAAEPEEAAMENSPAAAVPTIPDSNDTVIESGDTLRVTVANLPQINGTYNVGPTGLIFVKTLGNVQVKGLTGSQLQNLLWKQLAGLFGLKESPMVEILEQKRFLAIRGGVRYPGWYRVNREETFVNLLQMAGGALHGVDISAAVLKIKNSTDFDSVAVQDRMMISPSSILILPMPDNQAVEVDGGDLLHLRMPVEQVDAGEGDSFARSQVEVDRFGYGSLPVYGNIFVKGKTPMEIAAIINQKLPKYLAQSEKTQVSIIQKRHYVQVLGHVTSPGWYNIPETANVQAALNAAGSILDGAILSDVFIQRYIDNVASKIPIDLFQYSISGDERHLPPLHEDDTVFVPISPAFGSVKRTLGSWHPPETRLEKDASKKVRVVGAVNAPGVYEHTDDMDLLELLVIAKGETDIADLSNIQLIRDNTTLKYNLSKLLEDSNPLPKIQNGDTIRVGFLERTGYKKESTDKKVRIFGAVNKPGGYDFIQGMNLIDVLTLSGGERDIADMSNIRIIRTSGGIDAFDLTQILKEQELGGYDLMPLIFAGDTVRVGFMERSGYTKQNTAKKVRIFGAVQKPGGQEYVKDMHLLDILTLAGGERDIADLSAVTIFRANGYTEKFNLNQFLQGGGDGGYEELPKIFGGDTVHIAYMQREGYMKSESIYVLGQTRSNDEFELDDNMTVLQALSLAGGLLEFSDRNNIMIIRMVDGKQLNIPYNFDMGISGKYPELNIRLKPDDIIYVP